MLTIDVTDLDSEVRLGDEVVLIGSQGDEEITFEEMADKFSSVHTEINLWPAASTPSPTSKPEAPGTRPRVPSRRFLSPASGEGAARI